MRIGATIHALAVAAAAALATHGPDHGQHQRERLADALGIAHDALSLRLPRAADWGHILLCPDCGDVGAYKRWPTARWEELAARLRADGYQVAFNGVGDGDLFHLLESVAHASLVIGVDSGPVHLADLLSVPVIGLYAATSTASYGPYCDRALCVDKHRDAWAQCLSGDYNSAAHIRDGRAMCLISVDDVLAQVANWRGLARAA